MKHHPISKYAKQGLFITTLAVGFGLIAGPAHAGQSLSSTLEVYVFPKNGQAQDQQQGAAQQQSTQEQIGNFKKAFGVCLEAKDYMVKF